MATLTFVYAESTAVIGPLATADEPHSWDLCDEHARRITVPRGWEMLRSERAFAAPPEDEELTALAEAVREAGAVAGSGGRAGFVERRPEPVDGFDHRRSGRHRVSGPVDDDPAVARRGARPRPGRRGHLRVLPDPVD